MNNAKPDRSRHFLTLIDDYSSYTLRFSEAKSNVIEEYVTIIRNQFERNPVVIRSGRGGEYKMKRLGAILPRKRDCSAVHSR